MSEVQIVRSYQLKHHTSVWIITLFYAMYVMSVRLLFPAIIEISKKIIALVFRNVLRHLTRFCHKLVSKLFSYEQFR